MIVIPMAGLSSRFFKAGYTQPKYMLPGHGKPLFDHAVESFNHYFQQQPFLFICRSDYDTPAFIADRCNALGIADWRCIVLDRETRGQAETVALGLKEAGISSGEITIFNIDTFRPDFRFPDFIGEVDGYLEVFQGDGDNWSYARPAAPDSLKVVETAEKKPISDLCSDGLYYFANAADFLSAYTAEAASPASSLKNGELYVAPLYNRLITQNKLIQYQLIERQQVIFCGVPAEYDEFLAK
ncbi:capsular biosynthesis protein [Corallincola luteus]|uniref:Capsular biosynthesis protein n=1 Tax=Corallincola luteus TaxID=1775177 RepID=A0ABY2APS7_9GAMM|nr:glycosyltransferase family 2 protein [Corallincola luteus]TCI04119.1 capsular biosynthesis protein [Corallincola luteus]